jgi:uncharacterized membrane protein
MLLPSRSKEGVVAVNVAAAIVIVVIVIILFLIDPSTLAKIC